MRRLYAILALLSPGLPALSAYIVAELSKTELPDHFGNQIFLTEAALFYVFVLPAFLILLAVKANNIWFLLFGAFGTWPVWMFMMLLPSDAETSPTNPQLFLAPTTLIFGVAAAMLFILLSRESLRPAIVT